MSAVVANKSEMYSLYQRGRFGAGTRHWYGANAILAEMLPCDVVPRYAGLSGGVKPDRYGERVAAQDVPALVTSWIAAGYEPDRIVMGAAAIDSSLVLQGEVMRTAQYLSLTYTRAQYPMRKAFETERLHADGLKALMILKSALCPASWDLLNDLLDDFDGAVVEFSVWGDHITEDGRNTIFWEVRHY